MATQKILLIHASAGHGHEKAAKAVEEALRGSAASDVRLADSLSFTPPFFGTNYKNTYLSMIKRAPWLWGFLYGISDWRPLEAVIRPLRRLVNGLLARGVERLILEENPSVIVSTHFMSTEIAAFLKKIIKSSLVS